MSRAANVPFGKGMLLRILAALCVISITGCEFELCPREDEDETGASATPIVGGSVDTYHRSAVALVLTQRSGSRGICSGSMIAKDGRTGWVLTAAHCVQGSVDHVYEATDWRDCTAAGDPTKCGAAYEPLSWTPHPAYDPVTFANDVAIVVVDGATDATEVTPVAGASDGLAPGTIVDLAGYGRTYAGAHDPDPAAFNYQRNHVAVPIALLTDAWIRIDATTGQTACFGDSGGPAYAHVGGALRVVGVASNADQSCAIVANYARVADIYDDFVAPLLPAPPSGGGGAGGGGAGSGGADAGGGGGADGEGGGGGGGGEGGAASIPDGDVDPPAECIPVRLECSAAAPSREPPGGGSTLLAAALLLATSRRGRRRPG